MLQADFAPRGGATFNDGGLAHQATLESQLFSLKQYVESETTEDQAAKSETVQQQTAKDETLEDKKVQKKWWRFWK